MALNSAIRSAASRVVPLAIAGTQRYLHHGRSSVLLAVVNQPARNLLRTPISSLIHRYFTKPKLDESEVQRAIESQDAEEGFPFKFKEHSGQQTITLTREYQGETVNVEVSMPDLVTGEENDNDEEGEGSGNQSSIPLAVSKENGPFSESKRSVCFDCLHNGTPTLFISGFLLRSSKNWVSKAQSAGNQRHISSLVGTPETTRATTYPKSFCEWLAGIIDGDGSIQVSKNGCTSLEITMGFEDLRLLRYIQNMLGGGIKMRAGAKSYRYRLHNHLGMIKLMNCINGHIRHSARLLQLHRVCQELEIPVIQPIPLDAQSNWFAGFFDAEGAITIAMKRGLPQLSIRVTNKLLQDVEPYRVVFGGSLYFDSGRNGFYQWSIQSRKDVIMMLDYFKLNTFRSHKARRFFLIEEYYTLYDLEAFKPDSIHHKAWVAFLDKWEK